MNCVMKDSESETNKDFTVEDLLTRGWTRTLIERFLELEDYHNPVDHFRNYAGKKMYQRRWTNRGLRRFRSCLHAICQAPQAGAWKDRCDLHAHPRTPWESRSFKRGQHTRFEPRGNRLPEDCRFVRARAHTRLSDSTQELNLTANQSAASSNLCVNFLVAWGLDVKGLKGSKGRDG